MHYLVMEHLIGVLILEEFGNLEFSVTGQTSFENLRL